MAKRIVKLFWDAILSWLADDCLSRAAALAFYTAFSLAPILVIVTAVAGGLVSQEAVADVLVERARHVVGSEGADVVRRLLRAAGEESNRASASLIAAGTLVVGATTAFAELKASLDIIWRSPRPQGMGVAAFVMTRARSLLLLVALGLLVLAVQIAHTAVEAFSRVLTEAVGVSLTFLVRALSWSVSIASVAIVVVLVLRLLPSRQPSWRAAWLGAATTTVLFLVGRLGFGYYLKHTVVASSFGAASSIAATLLWIYFSAMALFFGAELAHAVSGGTTEPASPRDRASPARTARPVTSSTSRAS